MKSITALVLLLSLAPSVHGEANSTPKTIDVKVTARGYEPKEIKVAPNTDLTLNITRTTDSTCATNIQIPSQKIKKELPLNKPVQVHVGKLSKGEVKFGCSMDMMIGGSIFVN